MSDLCEQENCGAPLGEIAMLIGHMDDDGITHTTKMTCLDGYSEGGLLASHAANVQGAISCATAQIA